jgi:hypothetical protein
MLPVKINLDQLDWEAKVDRLGNNAMNVKLN